MDNKKVKIQPVAIGVFAGVGLFLMILINGFWYESTSSAYGEQKWIFIPTLQNSIIEGTNFIKLDSIH